MLLSYFKTQRVNKSSSAMFAGHDGRTANAEHQQEQ